MRQKMLSGHQLPQRDNIAAYLPDAVSDLRPQLHRLHLQHWRSPLHGIGRRRATELMQRLTRMSPVNARGFLICKSPCRCPSRGVSSLTWTAGVGRAVPFSFGLVVGLADAGNKVFRQFRGRDASYLASRLEPYKRLSRIRLPYLECRRHKVAVCEPTPASRLSSSEPGARFIGAHPLGPCPCPSLHQIRCGLLRFVHRLPNYMTESNFSDPFIIDYGADAVPLSTTWPHMLLSSE